MANDFRLFNKGYPEINTQDISDTYVRANFQQLKNFFQKENQLVGFKHLNFSFSEKTENAKIYHGLGALPQDAILTRVTGDGKLTLNWPLFDANAIDVTCSGPVDVRMFVGSYQGSSGVSAFPLGSAEFQAKIPNVTATTSATTVTDGGEEETVSNYDWALFPAGMWLDWPGESAKIPTGWCERDGRALATGDYPALFEIIGYAWGGSGASFNIPNTIGQFNRHLDTTALIDPNAATRTAKYAGGNTGAKVGTFQADVFGSHYHNYFTNNAPPLNFSIGTHPPRTADTGGINTTTDSQGGSETRPKNAATIGIIKLK